MFNATGVSVHIHPVALFSIVDGYERRPENSKRVIGTLLGTKEKGVVEVKSAYPVPHNETEVEVAVDMDFDREMIKLHQRVHPTETVVGWFSTSAEVTMHSVLIQDYYTRLEPSAIFVTLDTALTGGRLNVKAHVKSRVGIPGKTEGVIFTPVPCQIVYFEPEKVGVSMLQETKTSEDHLVPIISDFCQIERAAETMDELLEKLLKYVDDVIVSDVITSWLFQWLCMAAEQVGKLWDKAGKIPGDSVVGRMLMQMVSKVPKVEPAKLESMLNSSMQDLLMVVYLANLTKTQLSLGEKLAQLPS